MPDPIAIAALSRYVSSLRVANTLPHLVQSNVLNRRTGWATTWVNCAA
jgi:hypothetical protein